MHNETKKMTCQLYFYLQAIDPLDFDEETSKDDILQEFKCQECQKVIIYKLMFIPLLL